MMHFDDLLKLQQETEKYFKTKVKTMNQDEIIGFATGMLAVLDIMADEIRRQEQEAEIRRQQFESRELENATA